MSAFHFVFDQFLLCEEMLSSSFLPASPFFVWINVFQQFTTRGKSICGWLLQIAYFCKGWHNQTRVRSIFMWIGCFSLHFLSLCFICSFHAFWNTILSSEKSKQGKILSIMSVCTVGWILTAMQLSFNFLTQIRFKVKLRGVIRIADAWIHRQRGSYTFHK